MLPPLGILVPPDAVIGSILTPPTSPRPPPPNPPKDANGFSFLFQLNIYLPPIKQHQVHLLEL
jgi:hypothetical protein